MSPERPSLLELDGPVAVITVNRPDKLNALNDKTLVDIAAQFVSARDDETVRCVILTGAEAKRPSFVAGADIQEMADQTPLQAKARSRLGQGVCDVIENLGKPVIAAINGFAFGGGLELALACHIRLASADARLGLPEVTLGIIPGFGGTQRLPRIIGLGPALELLTTGRPVLAEEAHRLGLVNHVHPADELMQKAREMAAQIAANGPIAVRLALEAALRGRSQPLDDGLRHEQNLFGLVSATEDMHNGLHAFLEKRKPDYLGR
ncbi:MAG: enoyl-CoA hydratase-related protein [Planctomycetota bacterium]